MVSMYGLSYPALSVRLDMRDDTRYCAFRWGIGLHSRSWSSVMSWSMKGMNKLRYQYSSLDAGVFERMTWCVVVRGFVTGMLLLSANVVASCQTVFQVASSRFFCMRLHKVCSCGGSYKVTVWVLKMITQWSEVGQKDFAHTYCDNKIKRFHCLRER